MKQQTAVDMSKLLGICDALKPVFAKVTSSDNEKQIYPRDLITENKMVTDKQMFLEEAIKQLIGQLEECDEAIHSEVIAETSKTILNMMGIKRGEEYISDVNIPSGMIPEKWRKHLKKCVLTTLKIKEQDNAQQLKNAVTAKYFMDTLAATWSTNAG